MASCLAISLLLAFCSLQEHAGLRTEFSSVGRVSHGLWQILHGQWSLPLLDGSSWLASSMHLILFPLAPFSLLGIIPLLLVGPLCTGLAGWLLYRLALELTHDARIALAACVALLLSPAIQHAALATLQLTILAVPLLVAAALYAHARSWKQYWACITGLLLVGGPTVLTVLALAPLAGMRSGKHGSLTALAAILWGTATWFLAQHLGGALGGSGLIGYAYLGTSTEEIAAMIIGEPTVSWPLIATKLAQPDTLHWLLSLVREGGWLALLSPVMLLAAIPEILLHTLDTTALPSTWMPVTSPILATIILIAATHGLARIARHAKLLGPPVAMLLLLETAVIGMLWSPLPYGIHVSRSDYTQTHDAAPWKEIRSLIPPDSSVAAQANIAAQLQDRATVLPLARAEEADVVVLHVALPYIRENPLLEHHHLLLGMDPGLYAERVRALLRNPRYGVVRYGSGFVLLARGHERTSNHEALVAIEPDLENLLARVGDEQSR